MKITVIKYFFSTSRLTLHNPYKLCLNNQVSNTGLCEPLVLFILSHIKEFTMKITVVQNILLVLSAPWQPVILPKMGIVYDNEFDFINIWNCSMKFSTFDYFFWGYFSYIWIRWMITGIWNPLGLIVSFFISDNFDMNDKWCMKCRSL